MRTMLYKKLLKRSLLVLPADTHNVVVCSHLFWLRLTIDEHHIFIDSSWPSFDIDIDCEQTKGVVITVNQNRRYDYVFVV